MSDGLPVLIARIETAEGVQDLVTLLPSATFFDRGLVPEAIVGKLLRPLARGEQITPDNFARNRPFVDFLHRFLADEAPRTAACRAEAARMGNGFVYIIDQRTATPAGDVPPEDIVGVLQAANGEVVAGSYKPNPNHRILSERGFFRLGAHLEALLVESLERANRSAPPT